MYLDLECMETLLHQLMNQLVGGARHEDLGIGEAAEVEVEVMGVVAVVGREAVEGGSSTRVLTSLHKHR